MDEYSHPYWRAVYCRKTLEAVHLEGKYPAYGQANTHRSTFTSRGSIFNHRRYFEQFVRRLFSPFLNPIAAQVTDMQVLIKAAPVPAFVADRLVRKIVNKWIFQSTETTSKDTSSPSCSRDRGHGGSSGDKSTSSMPMLRRRGSPVPSASR